MTPTDIQRLRALAEKICELQRRYSELKPFDLLERAQLRLDWDAAESELADEYMGIIALCDLAEKVI